LAFSASLASSEIVPAATGSLTMTSDQGDYVGQGASYSYAVPSTTFDVQDNGNVVRVDTSVAGSPGDFWNFAFQAPSGQQLLPGTYQAQRWPFQPSNLAGLEVFGQGRGCNTLTGTFTVLDATYGPYDYLESFNASFSQHCEGATAALNGEIEVTTPTPPPALALGIAANATGTVSRAGIVLLQGTVTCTQPVTVSIAGTATQTPKPHKTASAQFTASSNCTPRTGGTWQANLRSATGSSFTNGTLNLTVNGQATDPFYSAFTGTTITEQASASPLVTLSRT
jgi:hypothetical protein